MRGEKDMRKTEMRRDVVRTGVRREMRAIRDGVARLYSLRMSEIDARRVDV